MALLPPLATDSARMSEEALQKPTLEIVEVNGGSIDSSQEELPVAPVRRKRLIRRFPESSSEEDYVPKKIRRKSRISYRESDSSSEDDSGPLRLPHAVATKSELPIGVFRGCPSCRTCQKVVATWRPDAGRRPCIEDAPVFYPNEEEFQHPLRYIASIRARAEPYGVCRIVPPRSWKPPCPLRGDSAAVQSMEFPTRVQQVHKLQVRQPTAMECSPIKQESKKRRGRASMGRMGGAEVCAPSPPVNVQPEYFGFWPGDPFLLGGFEKYANDFKNQYFRISERQRADSEHEWEPTLDMIEGEYWRIVEQATDQIEVLYGADVETGKFGSGFPKADSQSGATSIYENSGWNLNNIARYPGSMLSFEEGDISGVLVPWLYIGMCFSSFCWHVEDHHFYSLNYMHWGAPKIWYGVPGFAADKLEAAMKKHLPDLFSEQPDLLHKLVTQLSPSFLKQEGVPVYRLVQQPGEFVITFPNAYHSGFNAGFNVAEAVNVAPVDWLPHGQAAVELYRKLHRKTSVSHDKLLLGAARVAVKMWWHSQSEKKNSVMGGPSVSRFASEDILGDVAGGMQPGLVSSWQAYCGQGGVLARALKERVDMEQARRESLKSFSEETLALSAKLMDSTYDSTDERECELCKYDLHLSAVGCECCPDKFACLPHGHLLCSCPWSKKILYYRYHLEQLTLLLAAVEGRPGAVVSWIKQDSQLAAQSPSSVRDVPTSEGKLPGLDKFDRPHPCTNSSVVEISTQLKPSTPTVKEEMVMQGVHALGQVSIVPESKPSLMIQPLPNLVISSRSSVAPCDNNDSRHYNTRQESKSMFGHPQKVVFLKSGARKYASGQKGGEVILLSDDEDEISACKLNEAGESSFPGHETLSNVSSEAAECVIGNGVEGQAHQVESMVDTSSNRYRGLASNPTVPNSCGGSSAKRGPLIETSYLAGVNTKQIPTAIAARSPAMERAAHTLPTGSMHLGTGTAKLDERTAFPRPNNDLITVLQRNNGSSWTPPRVNRVRAKREVDLLDVGRLVVREGWHTRLAIFPAGFRSQTRFIDVEDVVKTCIYVSEIIDRGLGARPLFQVTHPTKREVYLHESMDKCWYEIQEQINEAIIARRANSNVLLPPLGPPPSGAEMFGFVSSSIIEAVEALDPFHQCVDYWIAKQNRRPDSAAAAEIRRPGITGGRLSALEPPLKTSKEAVYQSRIVNTDNRHSANIGSTNTTAAFQASVQKSPLRQGNVPSLGTYSTLQGLFQRASPTELKVLYGLFTNEKQGAEWSSAVRALTEEVQKRFS